MQPRSELQYNPKELNANDLLTLSEKYKNSYLEAEQNCAKEIEEYLKSIINKDSKAHWLFLINLYKKLPAKQSKLASDIKTLFIFSYEPSPYLIKQINEMRHYAVDQIIIPTIENTYSEKNKNLKGDINLSWQSVKHTHELNARIIQDIGNSYLQLHGEEPNFFQRLFHSSQQVANDCKKFKGTTPKEAWLFLANAYADLKNTRGEIAKKIQMLFSNAFNEFNHVSFFGDTPSISLEMQNKVKKRFPDSIKEVITSPQDHLRELFKTGQKTLDQGIQNVKNSFYDSVKKKFFG